MGNPGSKEAKAKLHIDKNLQIVFGVTLMAILGVSIITPAFPRMSSDLQLPPQQIGLLVTVFTAPIVFALPFLGILADRRGRKRILVPALFLFAAAGIACTFVTDFRWLLALRFIQGVGASPLNTLNWIIIGDLYSGDRRTAIMGYNASMLSVGHVLYPLIGGALATISWRCTFAVAALAIPIGLLVMFSLKNPEPSQPGKLTDYFRNSWQAAKNTRVLGLFLSTALCGVILYGPYITYFPFYAGTFGAASFPIGLVMSGRSVFTAITSLQLGRLARIIPKENILRLSNVLYTIALVLVPFTGSILLLMIPAMIFGIAHGLNTPSVQTLVTEASGKESRAILMSVNMTLFALGQTLGPLFAGLALTLWGVKGVFYAGAMVAVLTIFILTVMVKAGKSQPIAVKAAQ